MVSVREYAPDIYKASDNEQCRFALGKSGNKVLVVFGVNPSKANRSKSDATIRKVMGLGQRQGCDGWLMLNVYPQRATKPKDLHPAPRKEIHKENKRRIVAALRRVKKPVFVAAWGNLIECRDYLFQCLGEIFNESKMAQNEWFCVGLTKQGHPKHLARVSYEGWKQFDMGQYLKSHSFF